MSKGRQNVFEASYGTGDNHGGQERFFFVLFARQTVRGKFFYPDFFCSDLPLKNWIRLPICNGRRS